MPVNNSKRYVARRAKKMQECCTVEELAMLLKKQLYQLQVLALQPSYNTFLIPKKDGSFRTIEDPAVELKKVQKTLNSYLQAVYYFVKSQAAHGILYGTVEGALLAAGLDPHLGILHRMEYNRPSFVYDCIEPFRPWADRLVVQWVLNRQLHPEWFDDTPEGIRLNTTGKKNVIPVYFAWMDEKVLFNGRRIKRIDQVQYLATKLAQTLLNQNQDKG